MQAEAVTQPIIQELSRTLTNCEDIKRYIFAGNATFTIRSVDTQKRYTFKFVSVARAIKRHTSDAERKTQTFINQQEKDVRKYWIRLLVGPDNEHSFIYVGMVDLDIAEKFYTTRASFCAVPPLEAVELMPSLKALEFFLRWLYAKPEMTPKIEFWHSGRCGMCGKKLTVPESVERGIGPDCAGKL